MCPDDCRVAAWVKPFAAFKVGVNPGYCWEPVIWRGGRTKRARSKDTVRDYHSEVITLSRGVPGAKPPGFVKWIVDLLGADVKLNDTIIDLFHGSGAMLGVWRPYGYIDTKPMPLDGGAAMDHGEISHRVDRGKGPQLQEKVMPQYAVIYDNLSDFQKAIGAGGGSPGAGTTASPVPPTPPPSTPAASTPPAPPPPAAPAAPTPPPPVADVEKTADGWTRDHPKSMLAALAGKKGPAAVTAVLAKVLGVDPTTGQAFTLGQAHSSKWAEIYTEAKAQHDAP